MLVGYDNDNIMNVELHSYIEHTFLIAASNYSKEAPTQRECDFGCSHVMYKRTSHLQRAQYSGSYNCLEC